MNRLESTLSRIHDPDKAAMEAARSRQARLTKPQGSLGRLEELAIRIAGMKGVERPRLERAAVIVMAGDHGVCVEGVSAYPSEVTPQMVRNFLAGGAAINVFARREGARVVVVDVGVAAELSPAPGLYLKKVRPGTANIARGPAMSRAEAQRSLEVGIEVFEEEYAKEPFNILATGDMGIGNTTPSTALAAVFLGTSARSIAGRGTGVDDSGLERKIAAVERAIAVNAPDPSDPIGCLAAVGGLEIGAIAGAMLAAAASRVPILVDGFISGSAALLARALCPTAQGYMIASHASADSGHRAMLTSLGLDPLLDLGLRLGEGTGAMLAFSLCDAACRALDEMATFDEAGVSEK